eukprot:696426-Prorocentrum_minimum.AAC.2
MAYVAPARPDALRPRRGPFGERQFLRDRSATRLRALPGGGGHQRCARRPPAPVRPPTPLG